MTMSETTDNKSNLVAISNIQRLIGKRMEESKRTKPCFYLNIKADITDLNTFRRKGSKELNARLSTNDFFFAAMSKAVSCFPLMAGQIQGDFIKIAEHIDIGFAVAGQDGKLLVPVIRGTNNMTIAQISEVAAQLTQNAKIGKLSPDDMNGACIALSSLGMYGVGAFIAILPPEMTSILAIGKPTDVLESIDGAIVPRKVMSLTLSVDHRIVNPDYAAAFLKEIVDLLENPGRLI